MRPHDEDGLRSRARPRRPRDASTSEPGVPPYRDTWRPCPGVDDYFRETHATRRQRSYKAEYLPSAARAAVTSTSSRTSRSTAAGASSSGTRMAPGMTESWRLFRSTRTRPSSSRTRMRHYAMRYCGPDRLHRVRRHGELELRLPGQPGHRSRRRWPTPSCRASAHAKPDERVPGFLLLTLPMAEENQRDRLRRWLEFMEAGSWDELYPIKE